nr:uncharacterized protein LOC109407019 isoform X2 [Aedes albopictus]
MASVDPPEENLRCRFCLAEEVNELIPTFCIASTQKMIISHMALACTGIAISCHDKLPQYSCDECLGALDIAYACWKRCRQSWGNFIREPSISSEGEDYRCRICLESEVEELISLFYVCDKQSMIISEILKRFAGLDVSEKDDFPQYICDVCLDQLNTGFSFRLLVRRSYETLRDQQKDVEDDSSTITEYEKYLTPNDLANQAETEITVFSNVSTENQDPLMLEEFVSSAEPTHQPVSNPSSTSINKTLQQTSKSDRPRTAMINTSLKSNNSLIVGQNSLKKAYFSSPDEFKKLAEQMLNKSTSMIIPKQLATIATKTSATMQTDESVTVEQRATATTPNQAPNSVYVTKSFKRQRTSQSCIADDVQSVSITSLVPKCYLIVSSRTRTNAQSLVGLEDSSEDYEMENPTFSWARIKKFNCKLCDCEYLASELKDTCTICNLPFDNFLPNNLQNHNNQQEYVEAYCCSKCTFFSISLLLFTKHLETHKNSSTEELDKPILTDVTECDKTILELLRKCSQRTGPKKAIKRRLQVESAAPEAQTITSGIPPEVVEQLRPTPKRGRPPKAISTITVSDEVVGQLRPTLKRGRPPKTISTITVSDKVVEQLRPTPKRGRPPKPISTITISDDSDDETVSLYEVMDDDNHVPELETVVSDETTDIQYKMESLESELGIYYRNSSDEEFTGFDVGPDATRQDVRISYIDTTLFDVLHESRDYLVLYLKGALCCGCLQLFETRRKLRIHRSKEHPRGQHSAIPDMCDVCSTVPSNATRHHMLSLKPIFYFCKLCRRLLIDVEDFESHRKIEHALKRPRMDVAPMDLLVRKQDSESLLRIIENPTHCANPFKSIENKAIFQLVKETDVYKLLFMQGYLCCGCQHWFSTYDALLAHCGEMHDNGCDSDEYGCDLCKADCKSQSRLLRHQLQRSRKLHYYCKLCHSVLLHHADDYEAHRAVAHNYQLRPTNVSENNTVGMLVCKEL